MISRTLTLLGLVAFTFSPVHADDVERIQYSIYTKHDCVALTTPSGSTADGNIGLSARLPVPQVARANSSLL